MSSQTVLETGVHVHRFEIKPWNPALGPEEFTSESFGMPFLVKMELYDCKCGAQKVEEASSPAH